MQYFRKIVGDRIYLSPRGASDEEIEKFTEWMNDFQVTDYINKSEQIMTAIGEKEWLENTARKNENKNFNIIDLNSNKLIGTIGLEKCRNMKLEDVTLDDVDELGSIKIDRRKLSNEKIIYFLTKVKNHYIFKVNGRLVRMRFSEKGPTADKCLTNMLENLYKYNI